jgi:hypothetical protein
LSKPGLAEKTSNIFIVGKSRSRDRNGKIPANRIGIWAVSPASSNGDVWNALHRTGTGQYHLNADTGSDRWSGFIPLARKKSNHGCHG